MNKLIWLLLLFISLLINVMGCSAYSDMTGTVIDSETGKPIEGAVVLVEWTETKGIGLTHTESYKVQEVITDKDGKFAVSGVSNPFVNAPDLTVYKKGYVCWNNKDIFPDYARREDFKWQNNYLIKMERFKVEYSYTDHTAFISGATHSFMGNKKLITDAYRWEELKAATEDNPLKK